MSCSGRGAGCALTGTQEILHFPEFSQCFCPISSSAQISSASGNTVGQNEAPVTFIRYQKHLRLVRSWLLAVMGGCRASVLGEQNSLMDEVITARSATQRKVKSSGVLEGSCSQVATESQNISLTDNCCDFVLKAAGGWQESNLLFFFPSKIKALLKYNPENSLQRVLTWGRSGPESHYFIWKTVLIEEERCCKYDTPLQSCLQLEIEWELTF